LPVEIDYLGEGRTDEIVARRLIESVNGIPGLSYLRPQSGTGKSNLDRRLNGLNKGAALGRRVLVLRDLDNAACAPELLQRLLPDRHPNLLLRIIIPESESWFLADRDAYASFCGVSVTKIPKQPEAMGDPKRFVLDLADAGFASKLKRFLDDADKRGVPRWAALAEWNARFCETVWNPVRVENIGQAPSLSRTLMRLREMIAASCP